MLPCLFYLPYNLLCSLCPVCETKVIHVPSKAAPGYCLDVELSYNTTAYSKEVSSIDPVHHRQRVTGHPKGSSSEVSPVQSRNADSHVTCACSPCLTLLDQSNRNIYLSLFPTSGFSALTCGSLQVACLLFTSLDSDMDINSWRTAVPAVEKAANLDASSDSDEELPSLHDRFRKMLDPTERVAKTSSSSTSFLPASRRPPAAAPELVPVKAPAVSSMFINKKQREHNLPPPRQSAQITQYRQAKEVIEIEDSPPPASKQPRPSSPKRFLSPARQPLTEITSSSSGESLVQLNTNNNSNTKASTSSYNDPYSYKSKSTNYEQQKYTMPSYTPKKPSNDQYSHLPAKARIMQSFNPATPLGKPRDPTLYASHATYRPPVQSGLTFDPLRGRRGQ